MDTGRYRQILHQCFPHLTVSSMRFVGGGTFRVFEVSRGLIFRFPHGGDGAELLRHERRVCDLLAPNLPLPIPRYEHFSEGCSSFNQPVGGYRKLHGVALQDCDLDGATLQQVARRLGEFLSSLHSLSPELLQATGIPSLSPGDMRAAQRGFYGEIRRSVFPLLSPEERSWTEALFEPFLARESNWRFEPVLVHGDFDSSNILCDPALGTVTGIIDFEETGLGDPAWDFCVLAAEHGLRFLGDLLEAYDLPLDPYFVRRVDFHARRVLFHELLYGIHEGAQPFTDNGLQRLRRAMAGREPIGGWLAASTSQTRGQEGLPL